ncbi:MAG: AtpZ/AtpI family protein [Marinibacterium sp.]|nr:AtpZ/AtpI family protein [Marinibacterium sp.]
MTQADNDSDRSQRLAQLDKRIAAAKQAKEPASRGEEHHTQAQLAWRMVIELVAGLGIGFGMGYGLDALFGTSPIFMVLFIFLGLAAGVKTMMRSAEEVRARQEAAETPQAQVADTDEPAPAVDKDDERI